MTIRTGTHILCVCTRVWVFVCVCVCVGVCICWWEGTVLLHLEITWTAMRACDDKQFTCESYDNIKYLFSGFTVLIEKSS